MAFNSFAQAAKDNVTVSSPTAREGPELQEIQTGGLGLPGVQGEVKLRISEPWPSDALPPTTSSLLTVASSSGLLAAAGPNDLILTSTQQVRAVLLEKFDKQTNENPVRQYQPNLRIPRPRLSHVAFTADESALLVSAQDGGGIDAYSVRKIEEAKPAVSISTDGKALRSLVPNPAPDADLAPLVAAVTVEGGLLLADLRSGSLREGQNGSILRSGVSCVAWSPKGKALLAGLADGTAVQLKADGKEMALFPRLMSLEPNYYISNIAWLNNDSFFFVYALPDTDFPPQPCAYYIVGREPKTTNYTFQKLPDPIFLMGKERLPTAHYIARLRNFPPALSEVLLVAATSSSDVGLITKSEKSLSTDSDVANEFTSTIIEDDARRAVLPLSENSEDTSPIGMALDLSSTDTVIKPVPTNGELDESSHSVPQLLVLNNDGLLCSWWVIYNDSIEANTPYPGMTGSTEATPEQMSATDTTSKPVAEQAPQPSSPFKAPTSAFGQTGFGSNAPKQTGSIFGTPNISAEAAFGKSSTIGGAKSSWVSSGFGNASNPQGSSTGFGQPAFGAASSLGGNSTPAFGAASSPGGTSTPAFGAASSLGSNSAPAFGNPSTLGKPTFGQAPAKPAFGATGFGNAASSSSPFTNVGNSAQSGFASFASGNSFASQAAKDGDKSSSPFGQNTGKSFGGFGQGSQDNSISKPSPFGGLQTNGSFSAFNKPTSFKLDSTFQADKSAKDDNDSQPDAAGNTFGFGSSFGNMLGSKPKVTSPTRDKEEDMDEGNEQAPVPSFGRPPSQHQTQQPSSLVTPPSTIGQPKATPAPPVSNLFGSTPAQSTTPQPPPPATTGWSFSSVPSTTPKEAPAAKPSLFDQSAKAGPFSFGAAEKAPSSSPKIKEEPSSASDTADLEKIPSAPLPPDTMSKPRTNQSVDDPLPPDWTPANTIAAIKATEPSKSPAEIAPAEDAPLPPDPSRSQQKGVLSSEPSSLPSEEADDFSDFNETGEEDEEEAASEDEDEDSGPVVDSIEDPEQVATSPESSFKSGERSTEVSPTGGLFTKVNTNAAKQRPLFGEVGTSAPVFPPPKPQESPRSPSPIRNIFPTDRLRTEASRSVSAPADRRSVVDQRKQTYAQSGLAAQVQQTQQEELARQKQQQEETLRRRLAAETSELEELEDDDDERLREELMAPVVASETLDDFVTYQPSPAEEGAKSGVPAQIERLYRDINAMVDTFGINSRSLASFMKYQQEQPANANWPQVLTSETPKDALNDDWYLSDIDRLRAGQTALDTVVLEAQVEDVDGKLQYCQEVLSKDIIDLKMKFASIRKALNSRAKPEEALAAPLSAEQTAVQHDLRKAAAAVQSKLMQVEDALAILQAKVSVESGKPQKKPTIEAVTNTVLKMTKMAEQKSADIDLLERQLAKLGLKNALNESRQVTPNGTPGPRQLTSAVTPGSSVYHTPGSRFGGSTRSTPGRKLTQDNMAMIPSEDRERWQARAQRKKAVASMLRDVLQNRKQGTIIKA
ncbi:Nucleoporin [Cyphellophora attinorum]|uniref:Nucleoporin n=1 Tax=Cyphellophora attinorum TaxID=1664694 RepID=A0A0N1H961_9EURO|nr:Nucleoporin [Phialophora attinorum]KPI39976.1 Nucleoporin [Phialophora attinorum]